MKKIAIGFITIMVLVVLASGCTSQNNTGNYSSNNAATSSSSGSPSPVTSPSSSNTTSSSSSGSAGLIQVEVSSSAAWSGRYGDQSGFQTVDGIGTKIFTLGGNPGNVSATFQKKDGGSNTLTVQITQNGAIVESGSTSEPNGIVRVSHSF